MRKRVLAAVAAVTTLGAVGAGVMGDADGASRTSEVVTVQQVGHLDQYVVVLSDGNDWIVPRCASALVTSTGCWWDSDLRAAHVGRSFAMLGGIRHWAEPGFYLDFIN